MVLEPVAHHASIFRIRGLPIRQRTQLINALRGHLWEFGQIAPQGTANATRLLAIAEDPDSGLPVDAIATLRVLVGTRAHLETEIDKLDAGIARRAKENEMARRLMTVPGIGPLIATAIAVLTLSPETFRKARDFAAWLGLIPRQHSTGGKQRSGATTKMGERSLRRLLIIGTNSVIITRHVHASARPGTWPGGMLTRKPPMQVAGDAGEQDGADRPGPDGQGRHLPVSGRGGASRLSVARTRDAEEGREQFGATVVRRDRENQCATECLRARGFDLDLSCEHHTGLRQEVGRIRGRTHVRTR